MKSALEFFLEVNKLKVMRRTGWVLRGVENPETIAEHTFRVAVACWLLAQKKGLNVIKVIKLALTHDLCEVYAGDMTPFFYYTDLPKDKKEREKTLSKWVRLTREEKEYRGKVKFGKEKEGMEKLIKNLPEKLKRELFSSWLDYEKQMSQEGKFVRQIDRIETLIQSIEYFGNQEEKSGTGWWEYTEEIVDDPLLLDFLKVIQNKFYQNSRVDFKGDKDLENILDFLIKIGKLKGMPRRYWKMREVKEAETVAGHIFTVVLMAWVFGKQYQQKYQTDKLLKMALCHEISAVYTGDTTPYDKKLPLGEEEKREVLKKWVRLSQKEKAEQFAEDFKIEKESLERLSRNLKSDFGEEMVQLWREYREKSSPEGAFLSQLNVLAVLLQTLIYERKQQGFSASPIWEWAFEKCDNQLCFNFFEESKRKFYPKKND